MAISPRNLIALAVAAVAFFAIAELTYPGTVSNVTWACFGISLLGLIVLGIIALVQSRRSRAR